MAVQSRAEFSLNDIVNASVQNARSYTNLAQWLLEQSASITEQNQKSMKESYRFDVTSLWDWMSMFTTTVGLCGFGLAVWSLLRLRALTTVLALRGAHAYPITIPSRLIYGTTTKPTTDSTGDRKTDQTASIIAAIQTYLPLELSVILVIVLYVTVSVVYVTWRLYRKSKAPILTMTVGNELQSVEFPMTEISYNVKDLVFNIASPDASMTVNKERSSYCFIAGEMRLENINVVHEGLNLRYKLPTGFSINARTARKLTDILKKRLLHRAVDSRLGTRLETRRK